METAVRALVAVSVAVGMLQVAAAFINAIAPVLMVAIPVTAIAGVGFAIWHFTYRR